MKRMILCSILIMFCSIGQLKAEDEIYSFTPNQTTAGSDATAYITTPMTFTYNDIGWSMNQWNPKTLQFKTNQMNAAGEFNFHNTTAFKGKIKKVEIRFNVITLADASLLHFLGGNEEVTDLAGGSSGTWNELTRTLTWVPQADYTYFAFYQNGKAITGSNFLYGHGEGETAPAIIVTYEKAVPEGLFRDTLSPISICNAYVWNINNKQITLTESGYYSDTLHSTTDTITVLPLTIHPQWQVSAYDTVSGLLNLPYVWHTGQGDVFLVADSIKDDKIVRDTTLQTVAGCDSIVTFTLIIKEAPCGYDESSHTWHVVTDAEGRNYKTARIGDKCWMAENLRAKRYADGAEIFPIYEYGDTNLYGRLYSWYSALHLAEGMPVATSEDGYVQGACPTGWHIPSADEVEDLKGNNVHALHATTWWQVPGNNATGLNLVPSGYYNSSSLTGEKLNQNAYLWTVVDTRVSSAKAIWTDCHCSMFVVTETNPFQGLAIRCVRN